MGASNVHRGERGRRKTFCWRGLVSVVSIEMEDVLVGMSVGICDVLFVYPMAVVASRREAGKTFRQSLRMGKFYSGAWTAGTLLIPYSVSVEAMTKRIQSYECFAGNEFAKAFLPPSITAGLVSFVLQPIEKKLTMDQLLQSGGYASTTRNSLLAPVQEIGNYVNKNGLRALYGGYVPLAMRELIYIGSVAVMNPLIISPTQDLPTGMGQSFALGYISGMLSAPFQTINVICKDETNRGIGVVKVFHEQIVQHENRRLDGMVKRLFYGAMTRSVRTGSASVLYYVWRRFYHTGYSSGR